MIKKQNFSPKQEKELERIYSKLIRAEQRGFSKLSADEILSVAQGKPINQ